MAEEAQEAEGQSTDATETELSVDDYKAIVEKLRKENADRRVTNRELEKKASEYDKLQEANLSELEKAQKRVAELEADLTKTQRSVLLKDLKSEHGFDDDDVEFLRGDTEEELRASAAKLAAKLGKNKDEVPAPPKGPSLFPGSRGNPVGSKTSDSNDALRAALQRR